MKVLLKNESLNKVKLGRVGFSWTTLFFGLWVAFFRKDFKIFIPFFLLYVGILAWTLFFSTTTITTTQNMTNFQVLPNDSGFIGIINAFYWIVNVFGAFMYNKIYTQALVNKGYYPVSPEGEALLQMKGIYVPFRG